MLTRSRALFSLVIVVALAPLAHANSIALSAGPQVGWSYTAESKVSSPVYGGAVRLRLLDFITGEVAASYRSEDADGGGTIETIPVQVSAMLHVVPAVHATFGVGWYHVDASLDAVGMTLSRFDDKASDAGLHVGGGVDVPLSPRMFLNLEARYVFLGYDLGETANLRNVKADFLQLGAGIMLQLF